MKPKQLGRFKIVTELGRGAMGIVYKGIDPKIQRTVALKVVKFDPVENDTEAKQRFLVEGQATGKLSHPNILTIYDIGEEGDTAFIAMEYLEGGNLQDMIKENKLKDYIHVIDIVRQIADGLDHAHSKGIVHRDVKPSNIMMLEGKTPKLADFGLARLSNSNLTTTGTVLGTPSYMAPEQIRGRKVDGRADLFALGIIFYEMLTGEKPFAAESITSVIYRVVNEEPIPPGKVSHDLPESIDTFMEKALNKDPDKRFQTGKEFAEALDELKGEKTALGGKAVSASETMKISPPETEASEGTKKKKLPFLKIAGGVWILVAILALVAIFMGDNSDETVVEPDIAIETGGGKPVTAKKVTKPKAATSGSALLSIASKPDGAEVYINGKKVGETPYLKRRYKKKKFTLAVKKEGYEDFEVTFQHKKNRTFEVALNRLTGGYTEATEATDAGEVSAFTKAFNPAAAGNIGVLIVEAEPGDRVTIDGRKYKDFPVVLNEASIGNHNIFIVRKGHKKPYFKMVKIKRGETLKLIPFSD